MKSYNSSRQSRKKKTLFWLLILLIVVAFSTFFVSKFLKITEFEIAGISEVTAAPLYSGLVQTFQNQSIFSFSDDAFAVYFSEDFPEYEFIGYRYILPNKVVIQVKNRKKAHTVSDVNGDVFSVDETGYVFFMNESDVKANVYYDKPIYIADYVNDTILVDAFLYSEVGSDVVVKGEEMSINLDSGGKVILPKNVDKKRVNEISDVLQKILQKYRIEGTGIEFIDMRFSKPVIKFK